MSRTAWLVTLGVVVSGVLASPAAALKLRPVKLGPVDVVLSDDAGSFVLEHYARHVITVLAARDGARHSVPLPPGCQVAAWGGRRLAAHHRLLLQCTDERNRTSGQLLDLRTGAVRVLPSATAGVTDIGFNAIGRSWARGVGTCPASTSCFITVFVNLQSGDVRVRGHAFVADLDAQALRRAHPCSGRPQTQVASEFSLFRWPVLARLARSGALDLVDCRSGRSRRVDRRAVGAQDIAVGSRAVVWSRDRSVFVTSPRLDGRRWRWSVPGSTGGDIAFAAAGRRVVVGRETTNPRSADEETQSLTAPGPYRLFIGTIPR